MKPIPKFNKEELIKLLKSVDKKTWIGIAVGIVSVSFLWFVLIVPAWIERPELWRQIQNMDAQMRQVNALKQKQPVWEENRKQYAQIIESTKASFYREVELSLLLGQISKLAAESSVEVIASKPLSEAVKFPKPFQDRLQAASYDFVMQGDYHALAKFASGVESFSRPLRIQMIHIVPATDNPERHIATFDIFAIAEKPVSPVTASTTNSARPGNAPK
jgi:Tfp pilus assembly protein PilO